MPARRPKIFSLGIDMSYPNFRKNFYSVKSYLFTLYGAILVVFLALVSLLVLIPYWLMSLEAEHEEFTKDFKFTRNLTEQMWVDLMEMELTTDMHRLHMHRREASSYTNSIAQLGNYDEIEYPKEPSGYTVPSISAPKYGYGWSRLKCCCAMYPERYYGGLASLEVSYKCPVGPRGVSGFPGNPGDPGYDGAPGTAGEDYPTVPAGVSHKSGYTNGIPSFFVGLIEQPAYNCEPCPRGPPGQQGVKGTPGLRGSKGHRGNGGRHGIHGIPGNPGIVGEVGSRGRSGRSGVPGTKGLDGVKATKGARGAPGTPGMTGIPGQRGVSGPTGSMGPEGARGQVGVPGFPGQRGMDGIGGYPGSRGPPGQDGLYCQCPAKTHAVSYYENQPQPIPSTDYQPFDVSASINPPLNPPGLPEDYLNAPINNEASIYSPSKDEVSQEALKYAKPVYIRNGVSNQIPTTRPYDAQNQVQVSPSSQQEIDFLNSFSAPPFTRGSESSNTASDITGGGGSFDLRATRTRVKPIFVTSTQWPFVTPARKMTYGVDAPPFRPRNSKKKGHANARA